MIKQNNGSHIASLPSTQQEPERSQNIRDDRVTQYQGQARRLKCSGRLQTCCRTDVTVGGAPDPGLVYQGQSQLDTCHQLYLSRGADPEYTHEPTDSAILQSVKLPCLLSSSWWFGWSVCSPGSAAPACAFPCMVAGCWQEGTCWDEHWTSEVHERPGRPQSQQQHRQGGLGQVWE